MKVQVVAVLQMTMKKLKRLRWWVLKWVLLPSEYLDLLKIYH
jgi:hypothetical protein